jgi:homoserine dehydrogenase
MRIILIGYGNVGKNFTKILSIKQMEIIKEYGLKPKIIAIIDKGGAAINLEGLDLERILKIKEKYGSVSYDPKYGYKEKTALDIIESYEAEIVIETTPTNIKDGEPGLTHIKSAFKNKKHVITTNKGPLALALPALIELAEYNNVCFKFSGTVGGGTPILELAKKCLKGEKITLVKGILNGTTNYILTQMLEENIPFEKALENAQKLGYAEADPSMDIDGIDTACKLVIIANYILNKKVTLRDVNIKGISGISLKELLEAKNEGCKIKLVGKIDKNLEVSPIKVSMKDPICVDGTLNAVTFTTEYSGDKTIIGHGAGGIETASSIIRDLIDIKETLLIKSTS